MRVTIWWKSKNSHEIFEEQEKTFKNKTMLADWLFKNHRNIMGINQVGTTLWMDEKVSLYSVEIEMERCLNG